MPNGLSSLGNYRMHTASPLDVRKHLDHADLPTKDKDIGAGGMASSPLTSRAYLNASAPRPPAITAGTGRLGVR
jgi:hypothetical protein